MNREIKFRAWDKYHKQMITDYLVADGEFTFTGYDKTNNIVGITAIMQYIGLEDKSGVEIYEGDIVRVNSTYICTVVFGLHEIGKDSWDIPHVSMMFCLAFKDNSGFTGFNLMDGYEVIGNIYQNLELL